MSQPLPEPIQFGKYTLYERIGRGGMADVFKGRIQGPGGFERVFVVKRILPHLSDDQAFVKMFVEEAKLSARLNHPNIVQIFELGSVEGEFFISMEHVPGHDLAETMRALWKAWGAPRPDMVAYIGREMCRALGYAHALRDDAGNLLGMIHRDVSHSNVMLYYEGAVKLLDFGIAKALGDAPEVTKSGTLKGKYAYMAPEQTEGDDVDARIDIFAAGIVLHEVLSGRRLFKAQNDIQTIERVRRCEVRPPSQFNPAVSPALDAVVLKALARNREDRFQTASEMADALDDIVHEAHFTPQILAAILRETFGGDGTPGGAQVTDRRLASSITNTSLSTTASSGTARSPTVPPIALGRRSTGQMAAVGPQSPAGAVDSAAIKALRGRPLLKRGSFWVAASLCAAGIGVGLVKGVRLPSGPAIPAAVELDTRPPAAAPPVTKAKRTPVLIQTDPEGADLYVAGRLESLGRTPVWVTLELAPDNPARVMVRKPGFQDKAIAVESERPPTVRMIPVGAPPSGEPTVEPVAAERPGAENGAAATAAERARNAAAKAAAQRRAPARRGKSEIVDPF